LTASYDRARCRSTPTSPGRAPWERTSIPRSNNFSAATWRSSRTISSTSITTRPGAGSAGGATCSTRQSLPTLVVRHLLPPKRPARRRHGANGIALPSYADGEPVVVQRIAAGTDVRIDVLTSRIPPTKSATAPASAWARRNTPSAAPSSPESPPHGSDTSRHVRNDASYSFRVAGIARGGDRRMIPRAETNDVPSFG